MRQGIVGAAVAASALAMLGGCGSGDDDEAGMSTNAAATDVAQTDDADLAAFQDCLTDQGVDVGDFGDFGDFGDGGPPASFDPDGGQAGGGFPFTSVPEGFDQEAFRSALEACGDLAPEGFGGGAGGAGLEAFDAYLSCLADNGVESADVAVDAEERTPPSLDQSDPELPAASETCGVLLPQAPAGGMASTTTTTG